MDAFELHQHVVSDYAAYTNSFVRIADDKIREHVDREIARGLLWPDPLLQLNPAFEPGRSIKDLVEADLLHPDCLKVFRVNKTHENDFGDDMRLHLHQDQAVQIARQNRPYVLTTGTGSGKSLSYIVPIVDHILRTGSGQGIQAIVVYPMNALANSQQEELDKFLKFGFGENEQLVTYHRYTGQENEETRERLRKDPPDIILTNYVMLELILTRLEERQLVKQAAKLKFLVFDELHTYRGRQGADVAMLIRRCRDLFGAKDLLCVGTSATMATEGTSEEQAKLVSEVASKIFGTPFQQEDIIGETLRPNAIDLDFDSSEIKAALKSTIESSEDPPLDFQGFHNHPMASWIERRFGVRVESETGKRIRQVPTPITGEQSASTELAALTNSAPELAAKTIRHWLEAGSKIKHPTTGFPFFAFRLHQFITRGDTAWSSLELEDDRQIFLKGQKYVPGDRGKLLYPLVFCRTCGQEYYRVEKTDQFFDKRDDFTINKAEGVKSGYLYVSQKHPWQPDDEADVLRRIPDDWVEEHRGQLRPKNRARLPNVFRVKPDGNVSDEGIEVSFIEAPFRFCLNPECRVAYNARQRSDIGKLATIGTDGRSTATSVLALSTILKIRTDPELTDRPQAKKLLSFTDNRQDASLQAGHFNDFVEVSLVRSALYRAMLRFPDTGIRYDDLVHHVEAAMDLPLEFYSNDSELRGPALQETRRALRSVLSYFLYRDLERGWRITSPNLEQCGLLNIEYLSIREIAEDQEHWKSALTNSVTKAKEHAHQALIQASVDQRIRIIQVLLDHLRRSLCLKEDSLAEGPQDRISEQSRQRLCEPWVIEEPKDMVRAGFAWPRSRTNDDYGSDVCISPQSNFGLFLRRPDVLPVSLNLEETRTVIEDLFKWLRPYGLVEEVRKPAKGTTVCGYQIPSSVMLWKAGDGTEPAIDHLRTTQSSAAEDQANQYFINLYKKFATQGTGLEAREHTAQVPSEIREEREKRFRAGELDILFCSPTMELGVDISQLNVVNMRNVPPTPANYAQRSGRAGRSGQAAFVYTYCSGYSPHDQYYFRHPERMVAGAVRAPRVDLHNQDLIKSHIHAVWLTESGLKLGKTLAEILVVNEEDKTLPIRTEILEILNDASIKGKALVRGQILLNSIGPELKDVHWFRESWLEDVLKRVPQEFDAACERWRSLYRAAVDQRIQQNKIIGDHSRPALDRDRAKRLRGQAEDQIQLLTDSQSAIESDFYSFRYFASEGFLPGYNFPRLPLSAFIPARRGRRGRNEFLSRPRFLAISEFGPRAVVYHEGSQYRVTKVNLAFDENTQELTEYVLKMCNSCGYGHLVTTGPGPDVCANCVSQLGASSDIRSMVRLQNVTLRRANQITSDEEERQRIGYDIQTTYRFSEVAGNVDVRKAEVFHQDLKIATLRYGDAAQIWRINLGWKRRSNPNDHGFELDVDGGYWATNKDADDGDRQSLSKRRQKVVPYVEDHRNVLTIQFSQSLDGNVMATVQSALKQAIQQEYQLEPGELAAQPLPSAADRQLLFFYEASEGGAGVLRQLVESPSAFANVAKAAIELCHFDLETGKDISLNQKIHCEAACYDCLLEYGNQTDHNSIDRHLVRDLLFNLAESRTETSSGNISRADHLDNMMRQCDSELERRWLQLVYDTHRELPSHAQHQLTKYYTRPDFYYHEKRTAVYIDGPVHDQDQTKEADEQIEQRLLSAGIMSIRFRYDDDWETKLQQFPDIFGTGK